MMSFSKSKASAAWQRPAGNTELLHNLMDCRVKPGNDSGGLRNQSGRAMTERLSYVWLVHQ
jgi:hypothetical protein